MFTVGQQVKVTSLNWQGHFVEELPDPGEPEMHSELLLGKTGVIRDHDSWADDQGTIIDAWMVNIQDWQPVGYDDWWFLTSQLESV